MKAKIGFVSVLLLAIAPVVVLHAQDLCMGESVPVATPLTDMGAANYQGYPGGLYPDGNNVRPAVHESHGRELASRIVPLDAAGLPGRSGRIALISVGMSNTSSEFGEFSRLAHRDPEVNPHLVFVNGALSSRTAEYWSEPEAATWTELKRRLARSNLTPEQVQVAWVKQTFTRGGRFPQKTLELQAALKAIARNLHAHFPNLKIAYFSSRTRSYTYLRGLSPEPLAFEGGFAVKWMIEEQINGDPELNFDPGKGPVVAPYLSWGPYLWIDGSNPRSDGRVWTAGDMTSDCTHPSPSGNRKVAEMLMEFLKSDATAIPWFLASARAR